MKIGRLRDGATCLFAGNRVVDVGATLDGFRRARPAAADVVESAFPDGVAGRWDILIGRWYEVRGPLTELRDWPEAAVLSAEANGMSPPLPSRSARIFGIGANFTAHAARSEGAISGDDVVLDARSAEMLEQKRQGLPPWGFNILPGTVVGPDAVITPPRGTMKLDYEGEVACVLRKNASGAAPWGYVIWNDFSIRDPHFGLGPAVDRGPLTWSLQKNFDTGNACGPWVAVDEEIHPRALRIVVRVNDEVRQEGSTEEMVYTFEDTIAHIGSYLTLQDGDMITSGTPSGTALEGGVDGRYLRDGDLVEVSVPGLGVLRNSVLLTPAERP